MSVRYFYMVARQRPTRLCCPAASCRSCVPPFPETDKGYLFFLVGSRRVFCFTRGEAFGVDHVAVPGEAVDCGFFVLAVLDLFEYCFDDVVVEVLGF